MARHKLGLLDARLISVFGEAEDFVQILPMTEVLFNHSSPHVNNTEGEGLAV